MQKSFSGAKTTLVVFLILPSIPRNFSSIFRSLNSNSRFSVIILIPKINYFLKYLGFPKSPNPAYIYADVVLDAWIPEVRSVSPAVARSLLDLKPKFRIPIAPANIRRAFSAIFGVLRGNRHHHKVDLVILYTDTSLVW